MVTCAVTTSFLGCLVTLYLFFRYIFILGLSPFANVLWLLAFLIMGCIPLFVGYKFENAFGSFYPFYRYGLYFIYIGCVILLTLTLMTDAVWFAGYKLGWFDCLPFNRGTCLKYNLFTIAAAVVLAGYALYAGIKVPDVKQIEIASAKINNEKTIALLSDIHIHRVINPDKVKQIVERTNALNPDIILLDGDIIDDDVDKVAKISALLKQLRAKDGIYFVTGNHEFYAGYQETVNEMKKLGFTFLENGGVDLGDIYLAGIPDLFSGRTYGKTADARQAFAMAKPEQFRLLMSHTPADFGADNNFDLEVSGHTHGGQIFPFHLFALLHNKYLAGLYKIDGNAQIYVTRGAGQWGPQMRFLAPSEITLVKLTNKQKEKF